MLFYTDLKKGVLFVLNGEPYEVLDSHFLRMQQRKAVVQTKIRNLISGKITDRNFQPSDEFEEAEIEKMPAVFIYENRGEYWFNEDGNSKNRFSLKKDVLGEAAQFLKPGVKVASNFFNGKIIKISLPIKMDLKIIEAPPAIKGDTAQGGSKTVVLETGAKISAPLFVNVGDVVKVNTETGEYVERTEKA